MCGVRPPAHSASDTSAPATSPALLRFRAAALGALHSALPLREIRNSQFASRNSAAGVRWRAMRAAAAAAAGAIVPVLLAVYGVLRNRRRAGTRAPSAAVLSVAAQRLADEPASPFSVGWEELEANPYDASRNPDGVICLAMAENRVCPAGSGRFVSGRDAALQRLLSYSLLTQLPVHSHRCASPAEPAGVAHGLFEPSHDKSGQNLSGISLFGCPCN